MAVVLAIDFDHTLHDADQPVPGRRMGKPIPGARETLQRWADRGHTIIVHSGNRPAVIRAWLDYYDIPYHTIWGEHTHDVGKPLADLYIDDRAYRFTGDWQQAREDVELFVCPGRV